MTDVELGEHTVRGWPVLSLRTAAVALEVVPGLGGTVTSLVRRADGAELLWRTPWGLRHRGGLAPPGTAYATMIDTLPGGWHTLFPNGGDSVSLHGAEWGSDGEARLTWLDWTFDGSALTMTGRLVRSPFAITKVVTLHDHEVTLTETVVNVGGERIETMWASQLLLGGDLIGPGTTIDTTASTVRPDPRHSPDATYFDIMPWPRSHGATSVVNLRSMPGPGTDQTRAAYLSDFRTGGLTIRRPDRQLGVELTWDVAAWPHLWYLAEAGGATGFPWFGNAYYLAVTPASSWPASGVHDARRIGDSTVWVEPGESWQAQLTARVLPYA